MSRSLEALSGLPLNMCEVLTKDLTAPIPNLIFIWRPHFTALDLNVFAWSCQNEQQFSSRAQQVLVLSVSSKFYSEQRNDLL